MQCCPRRKHHQCQIQQQPAPLPQIRYRYTATRLHRHHHIRNIHCQNRCRHHHHQTPHPGNLLQQNLTTRHRCRQQSIQRLTRPLRTDQRRGLHRHNHQRQKPRHHPQRSQTSLTALRRSKHHRQQTHKQRRKLQRNKHPNQIPRSTQRLFLALTPRHRIKFRPRLPVRYHLHTACSIIQPLKKYVQTPKHSQQQ